MTPFMFLYILMAFIIVFVTFSVVLIARETLYRMYARRIKHLVRDEAEDKRPLHKTMCAERNDSTINALTISSRSAAYAGKFYYTPDSGRWCSFFLFVAVDDCVKFDSFDTEADRPYQFYQ